MTPAPAHQWRPLRTDERTNGRTDSLREPRIALHEPLFDTDHGVTFDAFTLADLETPDQSWGGLV